MRRVARTRAFDIVHAATPPDVLLLTALPLRRHGAALVLDHHDLSPELYEAKFGKRGPAHTGLRWAERLGFRLADVVIAPNESYRRVAVERGGKHPDDVFVVRNSPDPDVFKPVPRDTALARGAPHLIGYVGRMGRQDGVLEAMQALERLVELRTDWHAVFVGDGEMLDAARRHADGGRLAGHVTFPGFVSDRSRIVEILSSCDVCISPEPPNPLNGRSTLIKVAEYMSVARPIVAFDLHETAQTAGPAAVLVSDLQSFADAISALFDDPGRAAHLGQESRARILETYGWPQSVGALLAAYARATVHRSPRGGGA